MVDIETPEASIAAIGCAIAVRFTSRMCLQFHLAALVNICDDLIKTTRINRGEHRHTMHARHQRRGNYISSLIKLGRQRSGHRAAACGLLVAVLLSIQLPAPSNHMNVVRTEEPTRCMMAHSPGIRQPVDAVLDARLLALAKVAVGLCAAYLEALSCGRQDRGLYKSRNSMGEHGTVAQQPTCPRYTIVR